MKVKTAPIENPRLNIAQYKNIPNSFLAVELIGCRKIKQEISNTKAEVATVYRKDID